MDFEYGKTYRVLQNFHGERRSHHPLPERIKNLAEQLLDMFDPLPDDASYHGINVTYILTEEDGEKHLKLDVLVCEPGEGEWLVAQPV